MTITDSSLNCCRKNTQQKNPLAFIKLPKQNKNKINTKRSFKLSHNVNTLDYRACGINPLHFHCYSLIISKLRIIANNRHLAAISKCQICRETKTFKNYLAK